MLIATEIKVLLLSGAKRLSKSAFELRHCRNTLADGATALGRAIS